MKTKEYKLGNDSREAIIDIAEKMGNILGNTLGPSGRNYLLPIGITNDGKSIARSCSFENEAEELAALILNDVAERTDRDAGDGTTTSMVLATELVKELLPKVPSIDQVAPGQTPVMQLARDLEAEKDKVLAALATCVVPVDTLEQLEHVAYTSMEDRENAKIVAQAIWESGKDAHTVLEEGFGGSVQTERTAGITTPFTIASPFMYTNPKREAVYENSPVLVVNHVFESYRELSPFMRTLLSLKDEERPRALVIVAKQYSLEFIKQTAKVTQATKFPILLVSGRDDEAFEDIAAFCNAHLVDTHPKGGMKIGNATFKHTGHARKIIATSKQTTFIGGNGTELAEGATTTAVSTRVLSLRAQLEKADSNLKRKEIEERIAKLQGGIATIYVDAKTAPEKVYLKLKVEDAMYSCKRALEGGMVRGGGLTLKEIAEELGQDSMLYTALMAPYERIQDNHGGPLEIGPDVMDSYLVVKAALENAVSVVKVLLTTEGIIADVPPSMVEELREKLFKE